MGAEISIDLDPTKVMQALQDMGEEVKKLSTLVDKALSKDAAKSMATFEESAKNGTNKVRSSFMELGTRIKEDLKTMFDFSMVIEGIKSVKDVGEGARQVLVMERAFDKLNSRLKLSSALMQEFKAKLGAEASKVGQHVEDILPGIETVSAQGNINSPEELSKIGGTLAKAKALSSEEAEPLANTVIKVIQDQGQKVNAENFKKTMDALQGARVGGSFKTADQSGEAIHKILGGIKLAQQQKMGLGIREASALSAIASKAGEGGTDVMANIMKTAAGPGGKKLINSILGAEIFKGEKLDIKAFQNVNTKKMGQFGEEAITSATGGSAAELAKFIKTMNENVNGLLDVANGANETADQFEASSQSLAFSLEKFNAQAKQAGLDISGAVTNLANDVVKGKTDNLGSDFKGIGTAFSNNADTLIKSGVLTTVVSVVVGDALNSLMGKLGGGKGGSQMQKGEPMPVMVVNASEIGKDHTTMFETIGKLVSVLGTVIKVVAGGAVAGIGLATVIGAEVTGHAFLPKDLSNKDADTEQWMKKNPKSFGGEASNEDFYKKFGTKNQEEAEIKNKETINELTPDVLKRIFTDAVFEGTTRSQKSGKPPMTFLNPSSVNGHRGRQS